MIDTTGHLPSIASLVRTMIRSEQHALTAVRLRLEPSPKIELFVVAGDEIGAKWFGPWILKATQRRHSQPSIDMDLNGTAPADACLDVMCANQVYLATAIVEVHGTKCLVSLLRGESVPLALLLSLQRIGPMLRVDV